MKIKTGLQILGLLTSGIGFAQAQTLNLDPGELVNDYVTIGDWKTNGNADGWAKSGSIAAFNIANGLLEVTTIGGDPYISRGNFLPTVGTNAGLPIVEVKIRMLEGTGSGWEMFWGTSEAGQGGFTGTRHFGYTLGISPDGMFHIMQFDFSSILASGAALRDFRLDPGQAAGNKFQVDYVRVGRVMPDTDGDGLPDVAETKTGVFLSRRNTGTDPSKADTDGDGVADGAEVDLGTNPNDPTQFPVPTFDRYDVNSAVYVIDVAIADNRPTVTPLSITGPATGFAIQPSLPTGLALDPTSGTISGTPTGVTVAKDYTVVVTFQSGAKATNVINIEVRSPYIVFSTADAKRTLKSGQDLGVGLVPVRYGAVDPISYSITPALPDGLAFDPTSGTIYGAGTGYSPLTTNFVTAKYSGYPDSTAFVILSILENPVLTVDPTLPVLSYISWGEFNDPADTNNWTIRNSIAPFDTVVEGAMVVTNTGADPYFGKSATLATDFRILEIRAKMVSGTQAGFRTYWSENAPSRTMSEATSFGFSAILDGEYHVYQIDYRKATEGSFNAIRLDPGDTAGNVMYVDYWRFGSFDPSLNVSKLANGSLRLSWPSIAADYNLWSSTSLATGWARDGGTVSTEGSESVVTVQPTGACKYYRLQQ